MTARKKLPVWRTRRIPEYHRERLECWAMRGGLQEFCGEHHTTARAAAKHALALTRGTAEAVCPF